MAGLADGCAGRGLEHRLTSLRASSGREAKDESHPGSSPGGVHHRLRSHYARIHYNPTSTLRYVNRRVA